MSLVEKLDNLTIPQALMAGVGLLFLYYLAMYNDGSALERQILQTKQAVAQDRVKMQEADKTIAEARKLEAMVARMGSEMKKALEYLPERFSGTELMKLVSTEAKAAGANIVRVQENRGSSRGSNDNPLFGKVGVKVELEGAYSQMLLFLSHLTKVNKIVTVEKLNIRSNSRKGDDEILVKMSANLVGYHYVGDAKEAGR